MVACCLTVLGGIGNVSHNALIEHLGFPAGPVLWTVGANHVWHCLVANPHFSALCSLDSYPVRARIDSYGSRTVFHRAAA